MFLVLCGCDQLFGLQSVPGDATAPTVDALAFCTAAWSPNATTLEAPTSFVPDYKLELTVMQQGSSIVSVNPYTSSTTSVITNLVGRSNPRLAPGGLDLYFTAPNDGTVSRSYSGNGVMWAAPQPVAVDFASAPGDLFGTRTHLLPKQRAVAYHAASLVELEEETDDNWQTIATYVPSDLARAH